MKKIHLLLITASLCFYCQYGLAQNKYEREYRIRKSQFPEKALSLMENSIKGSKRIKFYKETDSTKVSFEAKLKKERLWYSLEFNKEGILEDVELLIKPMDIPNETYTEIKAYLNKNFNKYRIKRMQQQYPARNNTSETTLKNAFQNLILPSNNYELIIAGKKENVYLDYEILFDADGNFKNIRTSLPPNYDHVLY